MLRVHVLENGQIDELTVYRTSGHPDLDQAAVDAVRQWRFEPARRGTEAIAAWVRLPIKFALSRESAPHPRGIPRLGLATLAEGPVVVRRDAMPAPFPLKTNDDLFKQDTVMAGDGARVTMVLHDTVDVGMRAWSVVTLTEASGGVTVEVDRGQVTINARGAPGPAGTVDVKTGNTLVRVSGVARLRVETVSPTPRDGATVSHVDVLEGRVSLAIDAGSGTPRSTRADLVLRANQGLTITGDVAGRVRPVRAVSGSAK